MITSKSNLLVFMCQSAGHQHFSVTEKRVYNVCIRRCHLTDIWRTFHLTTTY